MPDQPSDDGASAHPRLNTSDVILEYQYSADNWTSDSTNDGAGEDELETLCRAAIDASCFCLAFSLPEDCEVSVVFSNDAMVQELNGQWRQQDKPTNVLSFAGNDGLDLKDWSPLLGDIILAKETISHEAQSQNKKFNDHLSHLVIHGFLHLLGYDHIDDEEAEIMENLEIEILSKLGIADPYDAQ